MITIAIGNHKGGVGKTTTAINLAAGLTGFISPHEKNNNVLLIDMDPQANATLSLYPTPSPQKRIEFENILTAKDVFEGVPLEGVIVKTHIKNLDLVPSSIEMFPLETTLVNSLRSSEGLKAAFRDFPQNKYDFVIIDCPPNLGVFMLNSFRAADYYILPIEARSHYSLHGIKNFEERIAEIREISSSNLKLLGHLITLHDGRTLVSKMMEKLIRSKVQDKAFKTIIRDNTDLSKAALKRKTIFEYKPECNGARDYKDLCEEVLERLAQGEINAQ